MNHAIDVLARAVERGAMPGATVCVLHRGHTLLHAALGTTDGVAPATTDTLYDLASLTKPLATASTVLALVERGDLTLTAPLADFVPAASDRAPVTLRQLLTHTSGLPAWMPCYRDGDGLDAAVAAILGCDAAAPGSVYAYSCLGYILLAKVVEVATGETLDAAARRLVWEPLGLESLRFRPGPHRGAAPTTSREGPEGTPVTLRGTVHDGNARAIEAGGASVSGNAGCFGTVTDVARFGEAVRAGGVFGAPTRARLLSPQSTPPGHTLAFFCAPNPLTPVGDLLSDAAVGHSGYTGTVLTIDPAHELTVAVLTNAVYGDGKEDWLQTRRRVLNAVAGAV